MIANASGVGVRIVSSPEPFFRTIDEWHPTHIALDLVMPEMDGIEVLVQLAARACRAKIIISSGMGSRVLDAAHRSASARGLDVIGVLAKPFSAAALRKFLLELPHAIPEDDRSVPGDGHAGSSDITEEDLREGLRSNQFRVVYQPKITCGAGALAGFEALARWDHTRLGSISPDRFIPMAEKHGAIDVLTDTIIEQAFGWFSAGFLDDEPKLMEAGIGGRCSKLSLSVNISAVSLDDSTLVERLTACCQRHRIPSERITLELTETSAMANPMTALDMLTRMRMKGFHLSIDDFGTGYSSMLQLVRMPFSEIKVDKSFVMSARRSAESRAVVQSVVDLGRSLGLKSTAEGVEDAETMAFLEQTGCECAQGYWIGRPMDAAEVPGWIASRRKAKAGPAGDSEADKSL
jgi:EAL domain-containing protein (putative c-di-GMP-specific phosphodiesterase class I)